MEVRSGLPIKTKSAIIKVSDRPFLGQETRQLVGIEERVIVPGIAFVSPEEVAHAHQNT